MITTVYTPDGIVIATLAYDMYYEIEYDSDRDIDFAQKGKQKKASVKHHSVKHSRQKGQKICKLEPPHKYNEQDK